MKTNAMKNTETPRNILHHARIQRFSRFCEELSGYTTAEIMGRHVTDHLFTQANEPIDPQKVWEEQKLAGFPGNITMALWAKNDQINFITWSARAIQNEEGQTGNIVLIGMDVSERERVAEALRRSEQKYRELVENANSIIMRWDREERITFMNEFGLAFFGYTEQELLGRHVMGTIVPETEVTSRDLRPLMEQILAAPQAFEHNVNENVRRDGSHVWVAWTNKVLADETGAVVGVLSIGQDITERKRMEEALREADRRKDEFLLMLSHELRNPLASTGYGSMEDRQQALASGFNAHLAKPFDLGQLRTLLGQYSGMAGVTEM